MRVPRAVQKKQMRRLPPAKDGVLPVPGVVAEAEGPRRRPHVALADQYANRLFVMNLMSGGLTTPQIVVQAQYREVEQGGPMSEPLVRRLVKEVWDSWDQDLTERARHAKGEIVQRIRRDLAMMRTEVGADGRPKVPWAAVARHESLLADIEGTKAASKVQVDHSGEVGHTMVHVIGQLSREELDKMVEEDRELERQAELGRAIEAHGVPVTGIAAPPPKPLPLPKPGPAPQENGR